LAPHRTLLARSAWRAPRGQTGGSRRTGRLATEANPPPRKSPQALVRAARLKVSRTTNLTPDSWPGNPTECCQPPALGQILELQDAIHELTGRSPNIVIGEEWFETASTADLRRLVDIEAVVNL
jgi:hypothetical protein